VDHHDEVGFCLGHDRGDPLDLVARHGVDLDRDGFPCRPQVDLGEEGLGRLDGTAQLSVSWMKQSSASKHRVRSPTKRTAVHAAFEPPISSPDRFEHLSAPAWPAPSGLCFLGVALTPPRLRVRNS